MSYIHSALVLAQSLTQTLASTGSGEVKQAAVSAPLISPDLMAAGIIVGVALLTLVSLAMIYRHVRNATRWSISEALSEEIEVATAKLDATGNPVRNNAGNIATELVLKASSSRLIALLGTVAIMMLYIGAGLSVLHAFAIGGEVPKGTAEITKFFLYGMVLFAPYIVNKFTSIFAWLK